MLIFREFKTASPSHLWNALQESMPEGRLPLNVSLASVMKDWIDSAGYPLVTVHARGQNIYFTQVSLASFHADLLIFELYFAISNS